MVHREMGDWLGAGDSKSWVDEVRRVCSTQYMLYTVYGVLSVDS